MGATRPPGLSMGAWTWDPSLFAGSAAYYARGRFAYPDELAGALAAELALDGTGRLLDVGCGPGSLTLPLAGWFERAIGVDADADMIAQAERLAAEAGVRNTRWLHLRAEELPAGLGGCRLIVFAQSFHWMDRALVAGRARDMLADGGACAHVHANTQQGVHGDDELPHPRPPYDAIAALVRDYLGSVRRAGQGLLPDGTAGGEDDFYLAAGLRKATRIELPGRLLTRDADDVVAAVFSRSNAAPHLFGERLAEFEAELRRLLRDTVPDGTFSEQTRAMAVDLWRP